MLATRPHLVVSNIELPAPPYPEDIRAKGWPFDIDCERVEQSATWTLAPPDVRPWLLMLWHKAWQQAPCGSLPGDDEILAATIGMPFPMFQGHRQTLLRGWVKHSDGRLYHRVLTAMVFTMMGKRRRDRERKSLAQKHSDGFHRIPTDSAAASASASASASATERLAAANAAPPAPKVGKTKLGTRLPDDWKLPDEWRDWAIAVRKDWSAQGVVRESITFRDYWTAKAGKDATKVNWLATWRTWIRRADKEPMR